MYLVTEISPVCKISNTEHTKVSHFMSNSLTVRVLSEKAFNSHAWYTLDMLTGVAVQVCGTAKIVAVYSFFSNTLLKFVKRI